MFSPVLVGWSVCSSAAQKNLLNCRNMKERSDLRLSSLKITILVVIHPSTLEAQCWLFL